MDLFQREREILFRDLTEFRSPEITVPTSDKNFKLIVPSSSRPVYCSRKVIDSSSLLMDMLEYVNDEDPGPIPVPDFISRQIVLDWVEIVEKEDSDCAHLVLVSLSYLLDFLISMDFLGCDQIKASVEGKIKEKIEDSNWLEVFKYTKGIMGLETTTKHALEHLMAKIVKFYSEAEQLKGVEDPFTADYVGLAPAMVKLLLKSHKCCETVKFKVINQWVVRNGFPLDQIAVFDLLSQVKFKDLGDCQIKMITTEVSSWNITEEQLSIFTDMVEEAKKERDAENEKRKKMRHNEKIIYKRGMHLRIQRHLGPGLGHQFHHLIQHHEFHQLENHAEVEVDMLPPIAIAQEMEEDEFLNVEMFGVLL